MQPLRTLSLWMDQLDEPLCARPALRNDLDVDVCIIGAGYTGLWTAYYLKRQAPQLNIAVIEAQIAGFGASGRNGGWLMGNLLGEDRLLGTLSPQQRRASIDISLARCAPIRCTCRWIPPSSGCSPSVASTEPILAEEAAMM